MNRFISKTGLLTITYVVIFFAINGYLFSMKAVEQMLGPSTGVRLLFVIFVFAAIASIYFYLQYRSEEVQEFKILLVLTALSPLLHVLFSWVGKPDPLLIIGYLSFLFFDRSVWVRNCAIFVMFLLHKELTVSMLLSWYLLYRPPLWATIRNLWPGFALGIAGTIVVMLLATIDAWYRATFVASHWDVIASDAFYGFPFIILLSLGWFWIVVAKAFIADPENRARIALSVLVVLSLAGITLDHTRIAVLAGFPLIIFVLARVRVLGLTKQLSGLSVASILAVSLIQIEFFSGTFAASHWPVTISSHPEFFSRFIEIFLG